jgi:hypothetical protein
MDDFSIVPHLVTLLVVFPLLWLFLWIAARRNWFEE